MSVFMQAPKCQGCSGKPNHGVAFFSEHSNHGLVHSATQITGSHYFFEQPNHMFAHFASPIIGLPSTQCTRACSTVDQSNSTVRNQFVESNKSIYTIPSIKNCIGFIMTRFLSQISLYILVSYDTSFTSQSQLLISGDVERNPGPTDYTDLNRENNAKVINHKEITPIRKGRPKKSGFKGTSKRNETTLVPMDSDEKNQSEENETTIKLPEDITFSKSEITANSLSDTISSTHLNSNTTDQLNYRMTMKISPSQ